MANDKNFKIKNGLSVGTRYLQTGGTETAGTAAYNLGVASYDSKSFSVASQDASPLGLTFNSDGTKVYIAGNTNDSFFQYSLSTAFDISTASYDSVSFSVASQDTGTANLVFNADGTKMYSVGRTNNSIYQYSLSTAFDISTASYDSVSFSLSGQLTTASRAWSMVFNNTGSKFYISRSSTGVIFQYSMSTAYDLSTTSYDSVSFSVDAQEPFLNGIAFNTDGTKLLASGFNTDSVHQYSLSTAFDLSTASYDNVIFDMSGQETEVRDIVFNNDGTKMYMIGTANDTIYQYSTATYTQTLDLSTGSYFSFTPSGATTVSFTNAPASGKAVGFAVEINGDGSAITWPSSVKWPSGVAPTATASKEVYAFVTTDGGTSYYGKLAGSDIA